ncbi:unnamed protein product [Vicia faba]|uniref:Uncharacterized protein n=1 Tax=Vicia faba TaxID=3906 RepID=A0AAV1B0P0_VICFA|nr:unnamed protein product [Vicia faba]
MQQLPTSKKEDMPSSSSSKKIISYKEITVNDPLENKTLDHMKTQFFYTFQSQASKDDMQSMKTSSSMRSIDSNTFEDLAEEAQNDDSTAEDFWDAMIQSMVQKTKEKTKVKTMTMD